MIERNLSDEITSVFQYIRDNISKEHPRLIIDEYTYICAVLACEDSLAYQAMSSIVMETTMDDMKVYFNQKLSVSTVEDEADSEPYSLFDYYIKNCDTMCSQLGQKNITSSILMLCILKDNEDISNEMKSFYITTEQFFNSMKSQLAENTTALVEIPKKHQKKKKNDISEMKHPIKVIDMTDNYRKDSQIERNTINISRLAFDGKVNKVIAYDKYYDEIFTILSKKERNNVAVCGKSGVGKTATVKNLANIINEKKCNSNFYEKKLVELDFSKLVVGTAFKGAFEQKFYSLMEEAKIDGNYIFFIDNFQFIVNSDTKYSETDLMTLMASLLAEPSIQVIVTMTEKSLSRLKKKTILGKYFQEVVIEEPSEDEAVNILNLLKNGYEIYHDVFYEEDSVRACVSLCKKYVSERALPDSAIDLMDAVGAKASLVEKENKIVNELIAELKEISEEIEEIKAASKTKQYDKIDELIKRQIFIKSRIGVIEKEEILSRKPKIITKNDVCSLMSDRLDIPLDDITTDDKKALKGLADKLKESIVGQDEAVREVCKVVKRQRVGLGGNERPSVLMFLGSTGVGKTYLAKQLAKEIFGSEKYFVRMDMSEYSDQTSVNKISGSNPGYVGYDNDTFLVKELKKKKRFVLLLDEFEKSADEVHNIFLQMFDEGRFTDNHGDDYSLKDVIIILTSNVGVAESMKRGNAIGFGTNDYDFSKSIIEKEMKKKFKPEFLNRIQKIIYFNKLDGDNLKSIIKLEINKLNKKIESLGYHMSDDLTHTLMVDEIYNETKDKKEYGARPIVNEVQRRIEDKIVDYIIENDVEDGHTFTYEELSNLE